MAKFFRILGCGLLLAASAATAAPLARPAQAVRISDDLLCTDGMETLPGYDDSQAMPVDDTIDGGCLTAPQPIAI